MANLIGTGLNQVPTNGLLGNMAFQNKEAVSMDLLTTTGSIGVGTTTPAVYSGYTVLDIDGSSNGGLLNIKKAGTTVGYINGASGMLLLANNVTLNLTTVGANGIIFNTNSTERMRIDGSGNVGIGATPSAWDTFKVLQVGHGAIAAPTFSNTIVTANVYYGSGSQRYIASSAPASLFQQADGIFYWRNATAGTAGNAVTFTTAMTLDLAGNLGLGVTPSAWGSTFKALQINTTDNGAVSAPYLQLFSNAFFNGTNYIYSTTGAATRFDTRPGGNAGFAWHIANSGTAGNAITFTQAMTLNASGNLGLAVTPSAWGTEHSAIQLGFSGAIQSYKSGTTAEFINVISNAYNDNSNWRYIRDGAAARYEQHDSAHKWFTSASGTTGDVVSFTQAMTLDASGRLMIGATSAQGRLYVANGSGKGFEFYPEDSSATNLLMNYDRVGGVYQNLQIRAATHQWAIGATERARIDSSGNFIVAKTSLSSTTIGGYIAATGQISSTMAASTNAGSTLEVYSTGASAYRFFVDLAGTINATNTSIAAISDIRLKENIRDLDTGLNAILALKPRRFDWKSGKGKDISNDMGFIAQEVEIVLPELIGNWKAGEGEPSDLKSVKAGDLIPVLVKAIQELTARVAQLEGE